MVGQDAEEDMRLRALLLSTHQIITVVLPTQDGKVLKIRKGTTPEPIHREIYSTLKIPTEVMKPVKTRHELAT